MQRTSELFDGGGGSKRKRGGSTGVVNNAKRTKYDSSPPSSSSSSSSSMEHSDNHHYYHDIRGNRDDDDVINNTPEGLDPSLTFNGGDVDTSGRRNRKEREKLNENEVNIQDMKYFATEHWDYVNRHIARSRMLVDRFGKGIQGEMGISNPDSREAREYYDPKKPKITEGEDVLFSVKKLFEGSILQKLGAEHFEIPRDQAHMIRSRFIGMPNRGVASVQKVVDAKDQLDSHQMRLSQIAKMEKNARPFVQQQQGIKRDSHSYLRGREEDDDDDFPHRKKKRRRRKGKQETTFEKESDDEDDDEWTDDDDDDDDDDDPYKEALEFIKSIQSGRPITKEELTIFRMIYPGAFKDDEKRTESFWDTQATKIHLEYLTNRTHAAIRTVIGIINTHCSPSLGGITAVEMIMAEDEMVFTKFVKVCAACLVINQVGRVSIRSDKTIMDMHKASIHECMLWSKFLYRKRDPKTEKYSILFDTPAYSKHLRAMKNRAREIAYLQRGGSSEGLGRMRRRASTGTNNNNNYRRRY